MTTPTPQPEYTITVRPLADDTDPDGIRRLRAWLKVGLRRLRLKCVSARLLPKKEKKSS